MPTEAQIRANRENAKNSCGPKTEGGKAKSKLNALKHGLRAQDSEPVLPHEDPAELEAKIQEWIDDYAPSNAVERELVVRAARLSWTLDRAERHEATLLSRNVRKAMLRNRARRTEKVCEYARKLFYMAGKRLLPESGPAWADDPSAFLAHLEETVEGTRWLLDRWVEMRCLIISDENWTFLDQFRFVRLLGKQPLAAIDDPELNEIFLAWETIEVKWGTRFWHQMQEMTPYEDPAFSAWRVWREIVPRPDGHDAAVAVLRGVADREIARLEELLIDLEEIEGEDALELAEIASFSASDGAERLRRFQTARTRELLRTIELLAKLRKASAPKSEEKAPSEPNSPGATGSVLGTRVREPRPRTGSEAEPVAPARKAPSEPKSRRMTYRSDGIEAVVAQGMTEYLGELLRAAEDPSRTPRTRANEAKVEEAQAASSQDVSTPSPLDSSPERTQRRSV